MKSQTTVQRVYESFLDAVKTCNHSLQLLVAQYQLKLLKSMLKDERAIIEKAFEDGIGEAMTDPERPLTGKEYYDIKYGNHD